MLPLQAQKTGVICIQVNGSAGPVPRAPPNDPERQGNIWQRYEQLESTSQELTKVNQQIVYERNKYRKVGRAGRMRASISQRH